MFFMKKKPRGSGEDKKQETFPVQSQPRLRKASDYSPFDRENLMNQLFCFSAWYSIELKDFQLQAFSGCRKIYGLKKNGLRRLTGQTEKQTWLHAVTQSVRNISAVTYSLHSRECAWSDPNLEFLYQNLDFFQRILHNPRYREDAAWFVKKESETKDCSYRNAAEIMKLLRASSGNKYSEEVS